MFHVKKQHPEHVHIETETNIDLTKQVHCKDIPNHHMLCLYRASRCGQAKHIITIQFLVLVRGGETNLCVCCL